jgi:hypothetical protein
MFPFLNLDIKELAYSFWHMWLLLITLFLTSITYVFIRTTKSSSGNSVAVLRGKFNCSDPCYTLTSCQLLSKLLNNKTGNVHITWHGGAFVEPCCRGKIRTIKYSECVTVALAIMQCACAILWPLWLYNIFPHNLKKRHDFRGWEKLSNKNCVFWFSLYI